MNLENEHQDINEEISSFCSERNKDIVKDFLGKQDENEPHNQLKTWRLKKKLAPKNSPDPPSAKMNSKGQLITEKAELEKLYLDTYINRLKPNPVPDDLKDISELKSLLFKLRMEKCSQEISPDWTMENLDNVLKKLKKNKARDAHGHVFELFKFGGKNLKLSLLKMFNLTKSKQIYPQIFQPSNISSIYKSKGRKDDLNSDRGVFNVVKLRSILDRLSYNDNYGIIDQSMSCSNIGARKNRNIRDHLFVINGILNEVMNSKKIKKVDIQIMDIQKCFDKMSYKETANDLYNAGVQNDHFVLMANSNKKCQVAVKTPWGSVTDRVELSEIEMQGTVPAPIKCSIQIDTLGKECLESGEGLYEYKECVNIPPLAMIDDILAVSECSVESVKVNALIRSKVAHKNLQLGPDKCFKMHVGKDNKNCCPTLIVEDAPMCTSNKEKYLGDILTTDGKINSNIEERYNKGVGIVNQIMSYLKELSFGEYYFEMAQLFRQSMLLNSILCNSEVLYGLNQSHIETLESIDKMFWRKVFNCPVTTPTEVLFLETNSISIRHVIMSRRLMYYYDILKMDNSELVKRVFLAQKISPCKNDWVLQVKQDLKECQIFKTECEIKDMNEFTYKKLVKESIKELSVKYLLSLKIKNGQEKSKSKNIWPSTDMKDYLRTSKLSTEDKQLLFSMRCRVNDVRTNYKTKYKNNMSCSLCTSCAEESESHLLQCTAIVNEPEVKDEISSIEYSDIFSHLEKQIKAVRMFSKVFKIRNWKTSNRQLSTTGHQVHLLSASCTDNSPVTVDASPLDSDCSTDLQNQLFNVYDFG